MDDIKKLLKRVKTTLKHVKYAPFNVPDSIEMFYTLQAVEIVLSRIVENEKIQSKTL